jgi:hypothetical protein
VDLNLNRGSSLGIVGRYKPTNPLSVRLIVDASKHKASDRDVEAKFGSWIVESLLPCYEPVISVLSRSDVSASKRGGSVLKG